MTSPSVKGTHHNTKPKIINTSIYRRQNNLHVDCGPLNERRREEEEEEEESLTKRTFESHVALSFLPDKGTARSVGSALVVSLWVRVLVDVVLNAGVSQTIEFVLLPSRVILVYVDGARCHGDVCGFFRI